MIYTLDALTKPLLFEDIFAEKQDLHLEIGVGKGRYLKEMALDQSKVNFIGLEKSIKWFKKAEDKVHKKNDLSKQVLLIHAYAEELFEGYVPEQSLSAIHIMFPDPWPKRRHLSRRIFSEQNIMHFHKALKSGGIVYFATDFLDYFEAVRRLFLKKFDDKYIFKDVEVFPYTSNFQEKYKLENRAMGFAHITKI